MKITRLGHACLLVESTSARVLVDPGVFTRAEAFELGDLDAVVVTHQHPDHLHPERASELAERHAGAVLLADPETAEQQGGSWRAHRDGDVTTVGDLTITGVGSRHAPILPELPRIANVGVLIADATTTLFHPGDSYESVPDGVDVLALPLTAPWARIDETVRFATQVGAEDLFPIHDAAIAEAAYGIYWGHVERFGGAGAAHRLSPGEFLER